MTVKGSGTVKGQGTVKNYKKICDKKCLKHSRNLAECFRGVRYSKKFRGLVRSLKLTFLGVASNIGSEVRNNNYRELSERTEGVDFCTACIAIYNKELDGLITRNGLQVVMSQTKNNKASRLVRVPYDFFKKIPKEYLDLLVNYYELHAA